MRFCWDTRTKGASYQASAQMQSNTQHMHRQARIWEHYPYTNTPERQQAACSVTRWADTNHPEADPCRHRTPLPSVQSCRKCWLCRRKDRGCIPEHGALKRRGEVGCSGGRFCYPEPSFHLPQCHCFHGHHQQGEQGHHLEIPGGSSRQKKVCSKIYGNCSIFGVHPPTGRGIELFTCIIYTYYLSKTLITTSFFHTTTPAQKYLMITVSVTTLAA